MLNVWITNKRDFSSVVCFVTLPTNSQQHAVGYSVGDRQQGGKTNRCTASEGIWIWTRWTNTIRKATGAQSQLRPRTSVWASLSQVHRCSAARWACATKANVTGPPSLSGYLLIQPLVNRFSPLFPSRLIWLSIPFWWPHSLHTKSSQRASRLFLQGSGAAAVPRRGRWHASARVLTWQPAPGDGTATELWGMSTALKCPWYKAEHLNDKMTPSLGGTIPSPMANDSETQSLSFRAI